MKIETLVLLLLTSQAGAQTAPASPPAAAPPASPTQPADAQNIPKEPVDCKLEVIKSYMLKGRKKADTSPLHVCPSVKSNCCTKIDQQKIFHIVNDIVPGRVLEYQSKMKLAMAKLKALHSRIMANQPVFTGTPQRREFCNVQARKIYNFPFGFFYNKILQEMENIRPWMNEYYQKFFCVLCDGHNHQFFNVKSKSPNIMLKSEYCRETLKENQEIVKLFNIELIDYLASLQHLVDCTHYIKSYNLKFFDERKIRLSSDVAECLNNLETKKFINACHSSCEQLKISKIVELIEGDFEFLIDAVNLFEKFFELKESGNLVSKKLRKFFSQFQLPRKLNSEKESLFLSKVEKDVKQAQTGRSLEETMGETIK